MRRGGGHWAGTSHSAAERHECTVSCYHGRRRLAMKKYAGKQGRRSRKLPFKEEIVIVRAYIKSGGQKNSKVSAEIAN